MTILVTGATGYIGREFIKSLQNKYNLIVLVRESSDVTELKELKCSIEKFDNYENINTIFENLLIDGVIHFASNVIVEHKTDDISNLVDSNIKYATFLLDSCVKNNVKWFINTGTFWQNYQNEDYNPVNLYASTKEAFKVISKYYTQTSDLIFTTIKLNDTFGPNDTRPKIFNLWDKYSQNNEILDMSKGEQIIDISYIEDIIYAYKCMIDNLNSNNNKLFNNEEYVVTSSQRMTLKELAKLFQKITNRELKINWGGRDYRKREVMIPLYDVKTVPNWKQQYSLEEAILKTIGEN